MEFSRAAKAIEEADYILIAAGAGFSADSGLPVYADIAQMEKYPLLGKTYDDLADTSLLVTEPSIFQDFWYSCVLKYSDHSPHEGYDILDKWCSRLSSSRSRPAEVNPFYVYTSNVDGFFRRLPELNGHLCEMHGSVEEYVCSSSMGFVHSANPSTNGSLSIITPEYEPRRSAIWDKWNGKTTPEQRNICRQKLYSSKNLFSDRCVDESDSCGTEIDLDKCRTAICTDCRLPLRPKVIMFGDACPCVMNWVTKDTDRYQAWENSLEDIFRRKSPVNLVILELGCGTRVPSVRNEVEEVLRDIADITSSNDLTPPLLVRVNISAADAAISSDIMDIAPDSVSIQGGCLQTLQTIDRLIHTSP